MIARVLYFNAEEAWTALGDEDVYRASSETIFTQQFYALPAINNSAALLARYEALREIRAGVLKQLEAVRASGALGSSLQADVEIHASGEAAFLHAFADHEATIAFYRSLGFEVRAPMVYTILAD